MGLQARRYSHAVGLDEGKTSLVEAWSHLLIPHFIPYYLVVCRAPYDSTTRSVRCGCGREDLSLAIFYFFGRFCLRSAS